MHEGVMRNVFPSHLIQVRCNQLSQERKNCVYDGGGVTGFLLKRETCF